MSNCQIPKDFSGNDHHIGDTINGILYRWAKPGDLGTGYLKDIGLKHASLSYTYSNLDKMYGASGYRISTYYFMGEKSLGDLL